MQLKDLTSPQRWYLNGVVALYQLDTNRLALFGAATTLLLLLYPCLQLKEAYGTVGAMLGLTAGYFIMAGPFGLYVLNPLCGVVILKQTEFKFGPKTSKALLQTVFDESRQLGGEAKPVDVQRLARSVGEPARR